MASWLLALTLLSGCASPVPYPASDRPSPAPLTGEGGAAQLWFDPSASVDAVRAITRATVSNEELPSGARAMLVLGGLSSAQLRDLARPVIPASLSSREVSSLVWAAPERREVIVAPLVPLTPGALYTLGISSPPAAWAFTVESHADEPALGRVWPPPDDPQPRAVAAVWCGTSPLSEVHLTSVFPPAQIQGAFQLGTGGAVPASSCLSWFATNDASETPIAGLPAVAPPVITLSDGVTVALEPTILWPGAGSAPPVSPVACGPAESALGPGCGEPLDDRLILRPPEEPLLWTFEATEGALVRASQRSQRFTVPAGPVPGRYRFSVLGLDGVLSSGEVWVALPPPRSHVVISEVLANPAGSEATEEWVELFNDSAMPAPLEGYLLEDGGGVSRLPSAMMNPGGYALVVTEGYTGGQGGDPSPRVGTLLLRVPALGRSGLSNEGEPLTLRDADGGVISRFPAQKTKNGVSVARVPEGALDEELNAFVPSPNGRSTPGAPNRADAP